MKYSRQKDEILKLMRSGKLNHPSAAEVFVAMKEILPDIGIATVYRNLNALSDMGFLRRLSFAGEADRYDFNLEDHHHAICLGCGKIFDFDMKLDGSIEKELCEKSGFSATSVKYIVFGYCKKCACGK